MGFSQSLILHPNFELMRPYPYESAISFALRCAAHLVSPRQEPDESEETECTDMANQIEELRPTVEELWRRHVGRPYPGRGE